MRQPDIKPLIVHASDGLIWSPLDGIGFYDVDAHLAREKIPVVYGESYFQKYQEMDASEMAQELNRFRVNLALENIPDIKQPVRILDVGIGGGGFIKSLLKRQDVCPARLQVEGVDINPFAINWLQQRQMEGSLDEFYDVVTFWDSLEHFRDPAVPLEAAGRAAIVSLPIFRDADHALQSKHYRKTEHFWYFTREGFRRFAERQGFWVRDIRITESLLGREDIETFVLIRKY